MKTPNLYALICFSAFVIAGCSSTPPLRSDQYSVPNPSKSIAEEIKEEQKSIAVTDIFYRKAGTNLKYVEEISSKYDSTGPLQDKLLPTSPNKSDADSGQEKSATSSKSDSDPFADAQTSAFPIKFTNVSDFKPSDHPAIQAELEAKLGIPSSESKSNQVISTNSQQIKKAGFETQVEYGQLRSFSAAIRGLLIKSGYKVVLANPAVPTHNQGDEYFDLVERIKAGGFNNADYVMYGILGEMSFTDNIDDIPGTHSTSQQTGIDLIVDFSLIDTKTYQIVASFLAEGNGKEVRIDGKDNRFQASIAKLMKEAALSLSQDVAKHLADQNFVTSTIAEPDVGRHYKRKPYDDDSSTLKIYTK